MTAIEQDILILNNFHENAPLSNTIYDNFSSNILKYLIIKINK